MKSLGERLIERRQKRRDKACEAAENRVAATIDHLKRKIKDKQQLELAEKIGRK